jgi:hypothetical protein
LRFREGEGVFQGSASEGGRRRQPLLELRVEISGFNIAGDKFKSDLKKNQVPQNQVVNLEKRWIK